MNQELQTTNKEVSTIQKFIYETKCRRCHNLKSWFFADALDTKFQYFQQAVSEYIDHPRLRPCEHCKKETIQDVVSYGKE